MGCFQGQHLICIRDIEIMTGNKKRLIIILLIKSAIFILMVALDSLINEGVNQVRLAPVIYVLFNLVLFNTVFFLPIILIRLDNQQSLRRNLVRFFVLGNTLLLWYFTIPQYYYLIPLILVDFVLFEIYLIRKLGY